MVDPDNEQVTQLAKRILGILREEEQSGEQFTLRIVVAALLAVVGTCLSNNGYTRDQAWEVIERKAQSARAYFRGDAARGGDTARGRDGRRASSSGDHRG